MAGVLQLVAHTGLVGGGGEFGQREIPTNGGEEIVEVVGDAASELANGAHFLGFTQLIFQDTHFGTVFDNPNAADDFAGIRAHRVGAQREDAAVVGDERRGFILTFET